jgi:hypothetical protein
VDLLFPKTENLGQPLAIADSGQQIQKESSVFVAEGSQPSRGDLRRFLDNLRRRLELGTEPILQIADNFQTVGIPLRGLLAKQLQADAFEFGWDFRLELARRIKPNMFGCLLVTKTAPIGICLESRTVLVYLTPLSFGHYVPQYVPQTACRNPTLLAPSRGNLFAVNLVITLYTVESRQKMDRFRLK